MPYISSIGLFNIKAKNVVALSRILLRRARRRSAARSRGARERCPGVGRKTANVVLNVAFGEPTIAVDTHVFRVANRTGLAPGRTRSRSRRGSLKFTPDEFRLHAHHWLILHGRYVCVARAPKCPQCVIRDLCEYKDKTRSLSGIAGVAVAAAEAAGGQRGSKRRGQRRRRAVG